MSLLQQIGLYTTYVELHNSLTNITKKTAMNYKQRLKIYRMLEKMTGEPANLQINEAIDELRSIEMNHALKSRLWYVYDEIMEQMRNTDANFAKALSKYIPQQDTMIIASSEQDDITLGFTTVIQNNRQTSQMNKAFSQALGYPLLMIVVLLILLFYFSTKIIPIFVDSVTLGMELSASSIFLMKMASSFIWWFSGVLIIIIALLFFLIWALPNWTDLSRKYVEDFPPFNMYRTVVGCGFLFALNSLGKSGYMQYDALEQMVKLAKPYLRYRIEVIMELMADGLDIGQALIQSKLNFPDKQMVRELAIWVKYSDDDSLEMLSKNLAEDGLESMKMQAQSLKYIIMIFVFGVIGFLYYAVYQFGLDLATAKV